MSISPRKAWLATWSPQVFPAVDHRLTGARVFPFPLRVIVPKVRLPRAAGRLQSSHCLVIDVADDLAIDPIQFPRAFKRIYGVSPSTLIDSR
jgi:AraC-like DNA-binding protein